MSAQGILIAGGYGVVGRRIAADLAPDYRGQVIIAGRNLEQTQTVAIAIGHGARGREVDVNVPSSIAAALDDVAVVISCIDQRGRQAMPFDVFADGADRPARAFDDPRLVESPLPNGARLAYLFPFSDQVLYPRTMGARTVLTRLAIEPAALAGCSRSSFASAGGSNRSRGGASRHYQAPPAAYAKRKYLVCAAHRRP